MLKFYHLYWLSTLPNIELWGVNGNYVGEIMLAGAVLMVFSGLLTMDDAYQAIDWKSIFVIIGMQPLGIAMTNSSLATIIRGWVVKLAGPAGPLACLFVW